MKAAYQLNNQIHVGEVPDPVPTKGLALVRTHCCGLCASDVHWLRTGSKLLAMWQEFGPFANFDLNKPFVPGHEYVAEIIDYGPGSRRPLKPGTRVTSVPIIRQSGRHEVIGHSNEFPGGFAEYMLLDEDVLMEIPTGLDDDMAAMTEPLATGFEHARAGEPKSGDVPLVIGCGAIGLGVIARLKLMGVGPIIAADFNAARRAIAIQMGAEVAIDPRELSPYGPIPSLGNRRPTLVYECVGVPGMLNEMVRSVGADARIVMGGFCHEPEYLYVPSAQIKKLKIYFARGSEPQDLDLSLRSIADGTVDVRSWLGARIGLSGVGDALEKMRKPSSLIRTVVDPHRM